VQLLDGKTTVEAVRILFLLLINKSVIEFQPDSLGEYLLIGVFQVFHDSLTAKNTHHFQKRYIISE